MPGAFAPGVESVRRAAVIALVAAACARSHPSPTDSGTPPDAGPPADAGPPPPTLTATLVDTRFHVAEHMRASIEMQLSGEPFAQILGFNLMGFARLDKLTDQYVPPGSPIALTAPLAYALAVESYEYSKQPMNNLSFESGAGLSLMYGPLLNPTQATGDAGVALLLERFQQFAGESLSGGPAGTNLIVSPAPAANPLNVYGWPGLWPVFAEFSSFDPAIQPVPGAVNTCTLFGSDSLAYGGVSTAHDVLVANYECDYNSLNLPHRSTQVDSTLDLSGLGYVAWKQGLWVINYWQTLQDTGGHGITWVDAGDLAQVGQPGNAVLGQYPDPTDPTGVRMLWGDAGVYLGDIPMEGWQGLTMMEEIDNKSALLLGSLLTADGGSLTGTSVATAIDYGYDSPLLYFPSAVAVTETPGTTDPAQATRYFPQPTSLAVAYGASRLAVLSGLIGGYAEAFAFTDRNNAQVGGSIPFEATFDGDPFPQDDGLPDGENTLHDRALGILKIALVDLDRLHFDPSARVLVDTAGSTHVSTVELAESILALRNAYRSLNGSLQLYSNDTPDTLGAPSALDAAPLPDAGYPGTLAGHLIDLIAAQADFLSTQLIDANGTVSNGYDLAAQALDPGPTVLESETGAIRALLEAYLATSNVAYRNQATTVYADLQQRFWMPDVRCFRTTQGVDSPMQFTPIRFGLLSGALRQYYKLVASDPARQAEAVQLLAELKRSYKLILNGWDDVDQDDIIQFPQECQPARLELGERALTGELGRPGDNGDRDSDCIREISFVGLPAALGAELDLHR
jgi:hypothetical protein